MAYVGQGIKGGTFSVLDTSGNTYNGSNVTFNLGTQVSSPAQLIVSHDGVIQKPVTDYTIATGGTQITFTTAPASGASIFITEISGAVGAPMNRDINGDELILDADADTSITADTDDQIDIRIGGTDQITIKDGALSPVTDNDIDLGTSTLEFKDAYFDGTVTTDALTVGSTGITANGHTFAGCLLYKTSEQTNISANSDVVVTWEAEVYDTNSFHDTSSNTSRITIPAAFNGMKARFAAHVTMASVSDGQHYELRVFKNGAANTDGATHLGKHKAGADADLIISGITDPITVATNDYFECIVSTPESDVDVLVSANGNNEVYFAGFSCEICAGS